MDLTKEKRLEAIRNTIENLSKHHHIEILKIIKSTGNITINENMNGVYINLTYLADEAIDNLEKYLSFVQDQETNFEELEKRRHEIEATMLPCTDITH